jgi:ADP-heptose:LPS heptosyltransferase
MAPGDVTVFTAFIRDFKLAFPQYEVDVRTNFPELFENNPHITPISDKAPGHNAFRFTHDDYRWLLRLAKSGEALHFVRGFHAIYEKKTKIAVPCTLPRPDIHLAAKEKQPLVSGRYWIVVPGGKTDMTTKIVATSTYQAVVDQLRPLGFQFVQIGAVTSRHIQPRLSGVLDLVGQTTLRDLVRLIYGAEGVICGLTLPMHLAAALERPCVVLAGGRETPAFEHYADSWRGFGNTCASVTVPHVFLHTIGKLHCCKRLACWRDRVVPLKTAKDPSRNARLCQLPTKIGGQIVPRCLTLITPTDIVSAVMSYYPTTESCFR